MESIYMRFVSGCSERYASALSEGIATSAGVTMKPSDQEKPREETDRTDEICSLCEKFNCLVKDLSLTLGQILRLAHKRPESEVRSLGFLRIDGTDGTDGTDAFQCFWYLGSSTCSLRPGRAE